MQVTTKPNLLKRFVSMFRKKASNIEATSFDPKPPKPHKVSFKPVDQLTKKQRMARKRRNFAKKTIKLQRLQARLKRGKKNG